jgi:hypothetical protein
MHAVPLPQTEHIPSLPLAYLLTILPRSNKQDISYSQKLLRRVTPHVARRLQNPSDALVKNPAVLHFKISNQPLRPAMRLLVLNLMGDLPGGT